MTGTDSAAHGNRYDWEGATTRALRSPGYWILVFRDAPAYLAARAMRAPVKVLTRSDGYFETTALNTYQPDVGEVRGDIWIRWVSQPERKPQ